MEILPALDLRHGKAVRLRQGDGARATVYDDAPARIVERFARAGARRVHVVDLDASFGEPTQTEVLSGLLDAARAPHLLLQLGGGLRDEATIEAALAAGCDRAVVGSFVAREPARFAALAHAHPGRLVPALDVAGGEVRIAGWRERAPLSLRDLCLALRGLPCPAVLVTDVERDGMMGGPNLDLACRVAGESGIPALLSGGVRSLDDLAAASARPEIAGAVVGRALYEGAFTLESALALETVA